MPVTVPVTKRGREATFLTMREGSRVRMIPIISLESPKAAEEIVSAFRTIGFVTLVDHGVPAEVTSDAFACAKSFFAREKHEKLRFKYKSAESNCGYIAVGQEALGGAPDLKESFDIAMEMDWPDEAFEATMLRYFQAYDALHLKIMGAIALGLGYDAEFFTEMVNGNHQNLRLLHYPAVPRGSKRGGIHTDYGTITLLSQEDVAGLVAQTIEGEWVPVPPVKGGIVVNIGEMLMRWSNDYLRATPHQVLDDAGDNDELQERYSIAFFCNANKDCTIQCLPGFTNPKYPPINAHDYITGRLAGTILL